MPRTLTTEKQRQQYHLNGEAEALAFDEQRRPICEDAPDAFTGYADPNDPVTYLAQVACASCPFLENCRARAMLERPAWGVWAGNVWDGMQAADGRGRIVRRQRRRQLAAYAEAVRPLERASA